MKKSILSLGKTLAKSEQKKVNGGFAFLGQCINYCWDTYSGSDLDAMFQCEKECSIAFGNRF